MMTNRRPFGAGVRDFWAYPDGVYRGALVLFCVSSVLIAFKMCLGGASDRVLILGLDLWGLGACLSWVYLNSFAPTRPKRCVLKEVLWGGGLVLLFVGLVYYFVPDAVRPFTDPIGDRLAFSAACVCLLFAVKVPSRGSRKQNKMTLDEDYPLRCGLFMAQVALPSFFVMMLAVSAACSVDRNDWWLNLPLVLTYAVVLTLCPAYVLWRMRGALERPEPMHEACLCVASLAIPCVVWMSLNACLCWQDKQCLSVYLAGFVGWLTLALLPEHAPGPYPLVNRMVQLFRTAWPCFFVLPLVLRGIYLVSSEAADLTRFVSFCNLMWLSAYFLGGLGTMVRRPPSRPLIMKTFAFLVSWGPLCHVLSSVWRGFVRPLLGI